MTILTTEEIAKLVSEIENANLIEERNQNEALSIYLDLWDKLPEPKEKQSRQISNWIIDCIFGVYFDKKEYLIAKDWAIKGLNNDTAKTGAYEYFQIGRVCYELGEYDEAMKNFQIAYERGKKRAFQEFDKKYWEFYSKNKK